MTDTELEAARVARRLLGFLGGGSAGAGRLRGAGPLPDTDPSSVVPAEARRVYDVRDVIRRVVDGGDMLEVGAGWARNLVTAFARIEGRSVGVIANQPRYLGGVLDADSSQKGARFVGRCNAFGIPLLVLVDTPGFMPGVRQETAGVIRFGATLLHAFAEATVPKVTVILRKAFGGAFITMNSKDLGADLVFAWPQAEIGVMGAKPAVRIIHRRAVAAADDPAGLEAQLAADYAVTHLRPEVAARAGYVDELIAPRETRERVAGAYTTLCHRYERSWGDAA